MLDGARATHRIQHLDENGGPSPEPVAIDGLDLGLHSLGRALDGLFEMLARGDITHRITGEPFNLVITVPFTDGQVAAAATIELQGSEHNWSWTFLGNHPDFHEAPWSEQKAMARERLGNVARIDFQQQTWIGMLVLLHLVDFIAGRREEETA
jgi:hypothetical protein